MHRVAGLAGLVHDGVRLDRGDVAHPADDSFGVKQSQHEHVIVTGRSHQHAQRPGRRLVRV